MRVDPKPARWGLPGAQLFPLAVAAIAVVALAGWAVGVEALTRVTPGYVPIAPSSALAFLALAAAIFADARWPRRRAATAVAGAGAAVVVFVVLSMALGMAFGLVPSRPVGPQMPPLSLAVPMSPFTGVLLLAAVCALVGSLGRAAESTRRFDFALVCAGLVLAGGCVITTGYVLGAPLLYGGSVVPVAAPTGAALSLAGLALVARLQSMPRRGSFSIAGIVALSVGTAVSFGLYAVVELAERAAAAPHVVWRGRTVLGGGLAFTWLLAAFLRARDRHHTETERVNRELRMAEARHRAVIESANDAIVTTDKRGFIVWWNAAAERIFGYSADEVRGKTSVDLMPERFRDAHLKGLARAADSGTFSSAASTVELVGLKRGGTEFPVELSLARWKAGEDVFVTAIIRDISDRKQAEELEAAVLEISKAANEAADLPGLLRSVHKAVERLVAARNFYVALQDRETGILSFPYFVDEADPPPVPRPARRGLTEFVLRTCRPQFVNPEMIDALVRRGEIEVVGTPAVDWLGVPLLSRGRAIGALVIQSYTEGTRYGKRDLDILTFVSREVAAAIERRRAQDELAQSEARYRAVVEDQTEMICRFRPDGEVTFLNEAYRGYFGAARKAEVGTNVFDALPQSQAAVLREGLGRIDRDHPTGALRFALELPGVGERTLAWTYRAILDEAGHALEIQAVGRDVTEQLRLETELREAQKFEAVARIAGGVAHEFNNDLQTMLAMTSVVRGSRINEVSFEAALGTLEDAIKRGSRHTRELLLFSQQAVSRTELLDLNALAESGLLERLVSAAVRLEVGLAQGPLPVRGDRGQLEQAIANLVVNGVDAMPQGGVLTVRTGTGQDGSAWLEVKDSGCGIPEDVRARLFEPFFTTKQSGTGLGLSVTHGIVTGLGGRIEVASEIGQGSTFRLVFPRCGAREPAASQMGSPVGPCQTPAGQGERILVVEDEEGARIGLAEALNLLGYGVTAVGSGEEAFQVAEGEEFDLLLTDVKLPGVQGGAVARVLGERMPAMKVIVMSGYAEDVAVRAEASRGASRFLQKPFDMETLEREVRAALDEAGGGQGVDRA